MVHYRIFYAHARTVLSNMQIVLVSLERTGGCFCTSDVVHSCSDVRHGIFIILFVLINVGFLKHSKLHYIISVTRVNMFVPDQISVLRPSTTIILYILFIYSVLCALSLSSYIL
jgi:hypothetical protein